MNLNLYGHDNQWLIVDCGVTFRKTGATPEERLYARNDVYCADPGFIRARRESIAGMVITHAHEDHVGAVPYLWPQLRCPIYTTAFTAEVLRRKLVQFNLDEEVPIYIVGTGETHQIGAFSVKWLGLTHSLPEAQALVINCSAGKVFHTGDWKIDGSPVLGKRFQRARFERLAQENIDAMVCDSTNATVSGWSVSEGQVYDGLLSAVKNTAGRAVVTCFGSNIARLVQLARIAKQCNRQFGVLGRSLQNMVSIAKTSDYWPQDLTVIHSGHLGYLPPEEVLAVATGSQGEPRTALFRLATDNHFDLDLAEGDRVIFSSRTIPGNEMWVEQLIEKLKSKKVDVVNDALNGAPIHASGHPCADELDTLYRWVQPRVAIPVHGEDAHMKANAEVAKAAGVERQLTGNNGDLFIIAPSPRVRPSVANVGQIKVAP